MTIASIADQRYWKGKRVLVTGGAGFIGSHLVDRLLPHCGSLVVPTRRAGTPPFLRAVEGQVQMVRGDLRDAAVADAAFRGADVALLLAAAVGGIEFNMAHHASIFRDNLSVFMASMEAARRAGTGRILVVSSACVYPRDCAIPTPESEGFRDRPEPTNEGYGWSKRMEEFLGEAYAREYGMSVAVARPYNAYGPRDNFDPASSHVIPALVRRAFEPGETLSVWGSGTQSRSFLHVTDFADGLVRICERATDAQATNLGADEETTMDAVARTIAKLAGTGKRVEFDRSKPEGQPRRHCDTSRLSKLFGFRARVSLSEGLQGTVDYYRNEVLHA